MWRRSLVIRAAIRVSEAERNAANNPRRHPPLGNQPRFAL